MKRHALEPARPARRSPTPGAESTSPRSPRSGPVHADVALLETSRQSPQPRPVVSDTQPRQVAPRADPPLDLKETVSLMDTFLRGWLDELDRGDRPAPVVWQDIGHECGTAELFGKVLHYLRSPISSVELADCVPHLRLQTDWIKNQMPATEPSIQEQIHLTERFLDRHRPASMEGLKAALDQVEALDRVLDRTFTCLDHRVRYLKHILVGPASHCLPTLWNLITDAPLEEAEKAWLRARWREVRS